MNIGYNPTTDNDNKVKPEVHIFNFNEDIYGQVIVVNFLNYLRDEKKFDNLEGLILELNEDKKKCLKLIEELNNKMCPVENNKHK